MSGEFLIVGKGLGIKDTGQAAVFPETGKCPECCRSECVLYFCGGSLVDYRVNKRGLPSNGSNFYPYFSQGVTVEIGRPGFHTFKGFCDNSENSGHARSDNVSNCAEDQFTTFKFNCNGDGTADLVTKNYVYLGNGPNGTRTQWRFYGYDANAGMFGGINNFGSGGPFDAWPWLECLPEYDETTTTLTVDLKYADMLYNDSFVLKVFLFQKVDGGVNEAPIDANEATVSFVSWSGPGSATASIESPPGGGPAYLRLDVDEPGLGVASGVATWTVSHPFLHKIIADVTDEEPDAGSLSAMIQKDYPHTITGTDSATVNFNDEASSSRCGYCVGYREVEIDFTTAQAEYSVILANRYYDLNGLFDEGADAEGLSADLWCGCGSHPWADDATSQFNMDDIDYFWVGTGRKSGFITGTGFGLNFDYGDSTDAYPAASNVGSEYGWNIFGGNCSRTIPTEFDSFGNPLEFTNFAFWGPHLGEPVAGWNICPLVDHYGHETPYPSEYLNFPPPYNALATERLGFMSVLTAAIGSKYGDKWPEYKYQVKNFGTDYSTGLRFIENCGLFTTFPGEAGEQRLAVKFEMEFSITFYFNGWDHWLSYGVLDDGTLINGTGGYNFALVDPLYESRPQADFIGIFCNAGKEDGIPVIRFVQPRDQNSSDILGKPPPAVEMPYFPTNQSIPIYISLEWDRYACEWKYTYMINGVDYADQIFPYGCPKGQASLAHVYCLGSSVAIADKSFRANHDLVPFIPNKRNFLIQNFRQEWTFT